METDNLCQCLITVFHSKLVFCVCLFHRGKRLGGWAILKCRYSVLCGWHWAETHGWCHTWLRQTSSSKNLLQLRCGIFLLLLLHSSGSVLLLINKQVQLPTQQKSSMDERVDALYDWVESPQGQTAPQKIKAEVRTALEGMARNHCSTNRWYHIICLFIPNP